MYCADTKTRLEGKIPPNEPACIPENVYQANDGLDTGISMVGYRSAKYSPQESATITKQHYDQSDGDVNISEQTRNINNDLIKETEALAFKNMESITQRLKERLTDTNFWKTELEREIKDLIAATDKIIKRKRELEKALLAVDEAVHICTDNLNARKRRYGEDLQQDEVEIELIKELDILNKSTTLYKQAIEQCNQQIKRNRDFKQDLEMIWSDKYEASELISEAAHLHLHSTNKQFYDGEARRYPMAAQSTIESWTQHTHDAILRSEHERMASEELYTLTMNIVNDVSRDVTQQKDLVNFKFQKHLTLLESELATYKKKLKDTLDEIVQQEKSIKELRRAISDKDNYLKLVQTRLHLHNQRPGVESVRDQAQQEMINEVGCLQNTLDRLNDQLVVAENNLKHLQDNQLILEKQIQMKQNTIQIANDHCVRHRMVFPNTIRLQGH